VEGVAAVCLLNQSRFCVCEIVKRNEVVKSDGGQVIRGKRGRRKIKSVHSRRLQIHGYIVNNYLASRYKLPSNNPIQSSHKNRYSRRLCWIRYLKHCWKNGLFW